MTFKLRVLNALGNLLRWLLLGLSTWLDNFRWVEFCAAIISAYTAGVSMANHLQIDAAASHNIGLFGAVVTALAFIRSPKRKWTVTK